MQLGIANMFYYLLQLNSLNAFRLAVVRRRVKNMRIEQAKEFSAKVLMRRFWENWLERCDECEELRNYHLTRKAHAHYGYVTQAIS